MRKLVVGNPFMSPMEGSIHTWTNGGCQVLTLDMSTASLINLPILLPGMVPAKSVHCALIFATLWKRSIFVRLYLIQPNQVAGKKLVKFVPKQNKRGAFILTLFLRSQDIYLAPFFCKSVSFSLHESNWF